jgi:hypothetical protein
MGEAAWDGVNTRRSYGEEVETEAPDIPTACPTDGLMLDATDW